MTESRKQRVLSWLIVVLIVVWLAVLFIPLIESIAAR